MALKKFPKYTITILKDNTPLCVVELQQDGTNSEGVDTFYQDIEALEASLDVLSGAHSALSFVVWKETGVLPTPPDFVTEREPGDAPF